LNVLATIGPVTNGHKSGSLGGNLDLHNARRPGIWNVHLLNISKLFWRESLVGTQINIHLRMISTTMVQCPIQGPGNPELNAVFS